MISLKHKYDCCGCSACSQACLTITKISSQKPLATYVAWQVASNTIS